MTKEIKWKISILFFGIKFAIKNPKYIKKLISFFYDYRSRGYYKNGLWIKYFIPRIAWQHIKFRMLTAYGKELTVPLETDIINYLNWRESMRKRK